jgi:hypothetical protein
MATPLREMKARRSELPFSPDHVKCSGKPEVRTWATILMLGVVILIACYVLWSKVAGF